MVAIHKNFELAFEKLKEFAQNFDGSEVQRAGIIQAFEFTYEQAWRTLQKRSGQEGLAIASPKKAFEYALQSDLILPNEEVLWLKMIEHWNLTTHTYKADLAVIIEKTISAAYIPAFESLLARLKRN
jgi:nucleotidyltransferase substrate binding protein (TIGR01987 family)